MKNEDNRITNFTIDHILNRAGQDSCSSIQYNAMPEHSNNINTHEITDHSGMNSDYEHNCFQQYTFQWLTCSRYHPPKLSRSFKKDCIKRQPGRHPRIPFTAIQLEILEKSYKKSHYLCPDEIAKLSTQLELSDTRIKIWFQNRRAREKREKDINSQNSNIDTKDKHII